MQRFPSSATAGLVEPGLLGNGKHVSFGSLVEFPFSLFIFLDLEPHVTHIARRLNKKLVKKVSQKLPKECPRGSRSLQKSILNTSKMGSRGGPRLLGGRTPFWHESGTLLGLHFAAQMTPRDAKVTLHGGKCRQKDTKFLQKSNVKIIVHFHTLFIRRTTREGIKICRKSVKILCKN